MASSLSILNESFVPLALFLDEKYTDDSFQENGIKALKGVDSQRFNLLEKASNKLSDDKKSSCFYIFKASLKAEDIDFRRVYYTNSSLDDEAKKKTEKEDTLSENSDSDESECDDYESSYDSCYSSDNYGRLFRTSLHAGFVFDEWSERAERGRQRAVCFDQESE
jgi:uncharacterized protein YdcH (DUF465 family)